MRVLRAEEFLEPGDGARPGYAGGGWVVCRARVVVKRMADTLPDVQAKTLLAGEQRGGDGQQIITEIAVELGVVSEHGGSERVELIGGRHGCSVVDDRGA